MKLSFFSLLHAHMRGYGRCAHSSIQYKINVYIMQHGGAKTMFQKSFNEFHYTSWSYSKAEKRKTILYLSAYTRTFVYTYLFLLHAMWMDMWHGIGNWFRNLEKESFCRSRRPSFNEMHERRLRCRAWSQHVILITTICSMRIADNSELYAD